MNTETTYMGIPLRNPIVLTQAVPDAEQLMPLEETGIGAVVLRPLLEEEIIWDIKLNQREVAPVSNYGSNLEYVAQHMPKDYVKRYIDQVATLKERLSIPVIVSIDCYRFDAWFSHIQMLSDAGCDAIEIDMQLQPYNPEVVIDGTDRLFSDITSIYNRITARPMSLKLGRHFTDMVNFMQRLMWMGVKNVTLFNSTPTIDIDLQQVRLTQCDDGTPEADALFWTAIIKNHVSFDLSTVVRDGAGAVKSLLLGATTAHICHRDGVSDATVLRAAVDTLHQWMQQHGKEDLDAFRGSLIPTETRKGYHTIREHYIRDMKKQTE